MHEKIRNQRKDFQHKLRSLSDRVYICECGNRMDRDVNAAINIRREGMKILCA
ncbi:MAG: zinc ribbon domain-containing protein [Clostridium sp.]|uniref:zinc ribbon domain-containing protein n=1 Tax=Clostridia TaxID=186801 RepID=UPI00290B9B0C|nr:zinc ribbon domain-containing protein [Clostridium sp.]